MSEMVERIKAELSPLLMDGNIRPGVDEEIARRILATMREPTEAMCEVANKLEAKNKTDLKHFEVTGFCALIYQAMIDEASK